MRWIIADCFRKLRENKMVCWYAGMLGKYLLVVLVFLLCGFIGARVGEKKALAQYEVWMEEYRIERMQIDQVSSNADPLNAEAELLAKVLYGVKDNSTDDLKTMCWCVFNRVDNPAFLNDLESIIGQPQQWMRYDENNPVLENLYQIAKEELTAWHSNAHRPCSADYVFMNWTPSDICLRDAWVEGSRTHYWRYSQ